MEVICEQRAHIYQYEMAAISAIAGCLPCTTPAPDGILSWDLIEPLIRPKMYYRVADRPHRAREHAQHARRQHLSPRNHRPYLRSGPRGRPARAPRRCAHLQRRHRPRQKRRGNHSQIRFGDVLPLQRTGRAGRLHARRLARIYRQSAHRQKNARRRYAPGGRARGRWAGGPRGNA